MRSIYVLLLSALLGSCALSKPLTPQQVQPLLGRDVYALVLRVFEGVEADMMQSRACLKQDLACVAVRQQARGFQYATVQVHGSVAFIKTLVPRGVVEVGDIVKLNVSQNSNEAPHFVEMGAKAKERSPSSCDWVDGRSSSFTGGVVCHGWSYKTVASGP